MKNFPIPPSSDSYDEDIQNHELSDDFPDPTDADPEATLLDSTEDIKEE